MISLRMTPALMLAASFVVTPAIAQESGGGVSMLDEIIVTSERRELSLQDTPASIVALSADTLEAIGIEGVADLSNFVPNLSIGGTIPWGNTNPNFSIRGVGSAQTGVTSERGVGLYIDDIYYSRTRGSFLRFVDVERVEVLRGPQGTLFGRNNTGGAIRYITKKPSNDLEGEINVGYGTSDRDEVSGLVNIPLSDNAALRMQAGYFSMGGYVDVIDQNGRVQDTGAYEDFAFRAALKINPSDRFEMNFSASYIDGESTPTASAVTEYWSSNAPGGGNPVGPPFAPFFAGPAQYAGLQQYLLLNGGNYLLDQDPRVVSTDGFTRLDVCHADEFPVAGDFSDRYCDFLQESDTTTLSMDLKYDFNDKWSIRSITGYLENDTFSVGSFLGHHERRMATGGFDSISQEFQLTYATERMNSVFGFYYFEEDPFERQGTRNIAATGDTVDYADNVSDPSTTSTAVFGQIAYSFSDKFAMSAGVRWTEDEKNGLSWTESGTVGNALDREDLGANVDTDGNGVADAFDRSDTFDSVDWSLKAQYRFNDAAMVYGNISTGYKAGGLGALLFYEDIESCPEDPSTCVYRPDPNNPYDEENVTNYEIGLRSDFADNRVRLNLTAYLMDYTDIQLQTPTFNFPTVPDPAITTPLVVGTGGPSLIVFNGGDVDISGLEADIFVALSENFIMNFSYGSTSFDWQRISSGDSPLFGVRTDPNCEPDAALRTIDNCLVRDLARSPENNYTIGANWDLDFSGGTLSSSLIYSHTDETESNNSDNSYRADDYGVTNLTMIYRPNDSGWNFSVTGSNIFDEEYITSGINPDSSAIYEPGAPLYTSTRLYGRGSEWFLRVGYDF